MPVPVFLKRRKDEETYSQIDIWRPEEMREPERPMLVLPEGI